MKYMKLYYINYNVLIWVFQNLSVLDKQEQLDLHCALYVIVNIYSAHLDMF